MPVEIQASLLRAVADQCGLPSLRQVAQQPGVRAVYRLTIRYHDRRASDSIATLKRIGSDGALLEIVYRGLFNHKPLLFQIEQIRYDAWVAALHQLHFDTLPDQPDIPSHGLDLWLLERAAGSFVKNVVLAPALATGTYAALIQTLHARLPESLQELKT